MSTALPSSVEAVTVPEVMRALRLSRSKVYDLLRTGRLLPAGRFSIRLHAEDARDAEPHRSELGVLRVLSVQSDRFLSV